MQQELIELLLSAGSGEYDRMDGNVLEFNQRFQSFLDQIPKPTGSSSAPGQKSFFRGQFLGMFAGMKNTEIYHDLGVQDINFKFSRLGNLHVILKQKKEQKIFIFTSDADERFYNGHKNNTYTGNICMIDISRKQGRLKINLMGSPFNQGYKMSNDFIKMPEVQKNNKGKAYKKLKDYISSIVRGTQRLKLSATNAFLEYNIDLYRKIKICLKDQESLLNTEAFQHGFLTGVLINFRFQDNLKPNIELISGKGNVDMFLSIRGEERSQSTIPIIIELKRSSRSDAVRRALNEAEWYAKGLYSNKLRIITNSKYVFCIGLDLNDGGILSSVQEIKVRNKPFLEDLLKLVSERATAKVRALLSEVHYLFPSTEYSYDYLSNFILGQSLILDEVNEEMISSKGIFKHSNYTHLTSLIFQIRDKLLIVHLSSQVRYINDFMGKKLSIAVDKEVKSVLEVKINEYNTQLHKSPGEYFSEGGTVEVLAPVSLEDYEKRTCADGRLYLINPSSAINLKNKFNASADYQHNQLGALIEEINPLVVTKDAVEMSAYKELFSDISKELFQVVTADFGKYEYKFKACLDGTLTGLSDIRHSRDGLTVMVPTEFQVGMGKRVDIAIQTVDKNGQYGTPVFIELKSNISNQEFIDAHDQVVSYLEAPGIKGFTDGRVAAGFVLALDSSASSGSDLIRISDKFIVAPVHHSSLGHRPPNRGMEVHDVRNQFGNLDIGRG